MADLLRQDGRHDEALDLLENGLAVHAGYKAGLVIQGRTLQEVGRQEEALKVWGEVLGLEGENVLALEAMALGALDGRDWEGAIPLLVQLCRLKEENSSWSDLLLEARGYLKQSSKHLSKTTGADIDDDRSFDTLTLVDIYLAQGYRDRALEVLRRMLPRGGGDSEEIQRRLKLLEAGESEGKEAAGPGSMTEEPGAMIRPPSSDASEGQLISEPERTAREQERSERRASEQRQFEEWLEKIRFNGGHGT
ncbi:MAG: hypothetical protein KOO60_13830 [Gemmatimonadales bacterium]|nr:hypothetical protein [Gemmatimonadales bacterium]